VEDYLSGKIEKGKDTIKNVFENRIKSKISDLLMRKKPSVKLVEETVSETKTPEKVLETKEQVERIDKAIKALKLSKRDENIFRQVKGFDETGKEKTYVSVAKAINITPERVRQIVEDVEGKLKKHRDLLYAGLPVRKIVRKITKPLRNIFLKAVEPTKILTEKLGKVGERLTARAIRFYHYPAYMRLKINQKQFNDIDKNVEQLEEFFHEYSQKDLKNFMVIFRSPAQTPAGKKARREALSKIPISLIKYSNFMKQIQELADVVNKYRNLVFKDLELQYFEDYFYGLYKRTNKSKIFFREHRSHTLKFLKQKTIPTPADAAGIGLELVNWNPITNLKQELSHIAYYKSLIDLREDFIKDKNKDLFMTRILPPTLGRLARASIDIKSFKEHSIKEIGKEKLRDHINRWYREQSFYDKKDKFDKRLKKFFELSQEMEGKTKLGWTHIEDRLFEKYLFEPSLAKVINNLISINAVTRSKPLNILRKVNRIIQFGKFLGSTFHQQNVSVQSIVDTRITDMIKKEGGFVSIAKSFKGLNQELKKTDLYKDYVSMGGSSERSLQAESRKIIHETLKKIDLNNIKRLYKEGKVIKALFGTSLHYSIGLPPKYVDWLFGEYIPTLKFHKYAYESNKKRIELGRELTDYEKLEIIKEGQNFYGMMNESLFGRSGTMTSVLRLLYLAPGYAEGNMRTIWKSAAQGNTSFEEIVKGQGSRSRRALIQSLLLKLILATTGTLMLTGKSPKKPENINDIRNLWKIDTGLTDKDNMPVMIDMLTYDRDYWNILVDPIIKGKPQNIVKALVKRLRGMAAPSARIIYDVTGFALGKQVVDWKNDNVVDVTDPTLQQMFQLLAYETGIATTPIMTGIYRRAKEKEVPTEYALPFVMMGLRVTRDEKWNEKKEIISKIYQLKDKQDKLYRYLKKLGRNPYGEIKKYNKKVEDWFNSKTVKLHLNRKEPILTKLDIKEMKDKLKIIPEKRLANELGRLTRPSATEEDIREAKKYLANFGIKTFKDAEIILWDYFDYQEMKDRQKMKARIFRLEKAFKED
ncbi:MAG: hypothetical protein H8D22_08685, partial [Candidatus Cloacimonetes bacterium]|nr:hypothetical protein [Candidatus Cloacimonadota bacterium]